MIRNIEAAKKICVACGAEMSEDICAVCGWVWIVYPKVLPAGLKQFEDGRVRAIRDSRAQLQKYEHEIASLSKEVSVLNDKLKTATEELQRAEAEEKPSVSIKSDYLSVIENESGCYVGEAKLEMKWGFGMQVTAAEERYAGEWRLDRKAGIGVEVFQDGRKYAGEWKNGKRHGKGTIYFPNSEAMNARFVNGELDVKSDGIYYFQDGSFLTGPMSENGPDGECVHTLRDGSVQKEVWKNGNKTSKN